MPLVLPFQKNNEESSSNSPRMSLNKKNAQKQVNKKNPSKKEKMTLPSVTVSAPVQNRVEEVLHVDHQALASDLHETNVLDEDESIRDLVAQNKIRSVFDSVEKVSQTAPALAFYLHYAFVNHFDVVPIMYKMVYDSVMRQSTAGKSESCLHLFYQLYSTFVYKSAPLPLAEELFEGITEIRSTFPRNNVEENLTILEQRSIPLIESQLHLLINACNEDKKLKQSLLDTLTHKREEDLSLFHQILNDDFNQFCKEGKHVLNAKAKTWCLMRIGVHLSGLPISIGEDGDSFSLTPSMDDDTRSMGGYSIDSQVSTSSTLLSAGNNFSCFWTKTKDLPWLHNSRRSIFAFRKEAKVTIKNHTFNRLSLDEVQNCHVCHAFLWGPETLALVCQKCHIFIHPHCQGDSLQKCNIKASKTKVTTAEPSVAVVPAAVVDNDGEVKLKKKDGLGSTPSLRSSQALPNSPQSTRIRESLFDGILPGALSRKSFNRKDLSDFFPSDDEYFLVSESFDANETKIIFPDSSELEANQLRRHHALAEVHYYVRYTLKQLKILHVFSHNRWNDLIPENLKYLWQSFCFDSVPLLVQMYLNLHEIILQKCSKQTYEPFGNEILEWLNKNEVSLFTHINRLCASVSNPHLWSEVTKQQLQNPTLNELFNDHQYQRFTMREKIEGVHLIFTIRINLLLKNTVEKLTKCHCHDEVQAWEKILQWLTRVAVYQNSIIRPVLGLLGNNNYNNDIELSSAPDFQNFPKQLCPSFLFNYSKVNLQTMTTTITSTINNSDKKENFVIVKENRGALFLLYDSHFVILQQENVDKFNLKSYKTRRAEAGSRGTTPPSITPIFNYQDIVTVSQANKSTNLNILMVGQRSSIILTINYTDHEIAEQWKNQIESISSSRKHFNDNCWPNFLESLDKKCSSVSMESVASEQENGGEQISARDSTAADSGKEEIKDDDVGQQSIDCSNNDAEDIPIKSEIMETTTADSLLHRRPNLFALLPANQVLTMERTRIIFALEYAERATQDLLHYSRSLQLCEAQNADPIDKLTGSVLAMLEKSAQLQSVLNTLSIRCFHSEANNELHSTTATTTATTCRIEERTHVETIRNLLHLMQLEVDRLEVATASGETTPQKPLSPVTEKLWPESEFESNERQEDHEIQTHELLLTIDEDGQNFKKETDAITDNDDKAEYFDTVEGPADEKENVLVEETNNEIDLNKPTDEAEIEKISFQNDLTESNEIRFPDTLEKPSEPCCCDNVDVYNNNENNVDNIVGDINNELSLNEFSSNLVDEIIQRAVEQASNETQTIEDGSIIMAKEIVDLILDDCLKMLNADGE